MQKRMKKILLYGFCIWMTCIHIPSLSLAALVVESEVVSGNIAQKYVDRSIKLDNGGIYHPSREELVIDLPAGSPVTLRYYVDGSERNIFFEFAPGLDSLKN